MDQFLQNEKWVLHEVAHVLQFKQYGLFCFMCMYIFDTIKKGYKMSKWEIAARKAEDDPKFLNQYKIIFNHKLAFLD